jgi:hypothetical protein
MPFAPAPEVAAILRRTGLDSHFKIFSTVLTAAGAPPHLGLPDASLRRYLPMSRLKTKVKRQGS